MGPVAHTGLHVPICRVVARLPALTHAQLSLHDGYSSYMESTLQLATSQGVVLPPRSSAAKSVLSSLKATLTFYLPDEDVGAILGRKGQNLADIQQVCTFRVMGSKQLAMILDLLSKNRYWCTACTMTSLRYALPCR